MFLLNTAKMVLTFLECAFEFEILGETEYTFNANIHIPWCKNSELPSWLSMKIITASSTAWSLGARCFWNILYVCHFVYSLQWIYKVGHCVHFTDEENRAQ